MMISQRQFAHAFYNCLFLSNHHHNNPTFNYFCRQQSAAPMPERHFFSFLERLYVHLDEIWVRNIARQQ